MESYGRGEGGGRAAADQDTSRHLARPLDQPQDLGYVLHRQFMTWKIVEDSSSPNAAVLSPESEVDVRVRIWYKNLQLCGWI